MKRRGHSKPPKRRTTLTLPAETLAQAERIARQRNATLSSVVAEVLKEGLRFHTAARSSYEVLKGYQQAFAGFSEQEMMILDGIILEPISGRRRA